MSALGVQYVRPDGSDSNKGETWAKAKQTIEAAQGDLPSAWPTRGGTIHLSAGLHQAHELDITVPSTTIKGAGRGATTIVPQGDYGLELSAWFVSLQNVMVSAQTGDPFYGQAIRVTSDRNTTLRDIWCHYLGEDYDGTDDIDIAPAAVWVGGVESFSDFHVFDNITVWGCYRGLVNAGSANFKVSNSDINAVEEGVYSLRRDISSAEKGFGGAVQASQCWFTGGKDYLVRLDIDDDVQYANVGTRFVGCNFEPGQGGDSGHIWCNQADVIVSGSKFIGGSHSTDPSPHAVYFGSRAKDCVVTGYTKSAGGFGVPSFYGNTAAQATLEA